LPALPQPLPVQWLRWARASLRAQVSHRPQQSRRQLRCSRCSAASPQLHLARLRPLAQAWLAQAWSHV
jgi:hypothetical protein